MKVKHAVILMAGKGTRFLPATKAATGTQPYFIKFIFVEYNINTGCLLYDIYTLYDYYLAWTFYLQKKKDTNLIHLELI